MSRKPAEPLAESGAIVECELIYGMKAADYHNDPCDVPSLSVSFAKRMIQQSPAHAIIIHPRREELTGVKGAKVNPVHTKDMDLGTVLHGMLLGNLGEVCEQVDADSFRTKAAREERDRIREAGKVPVLAKDITKADVIKAALLQRMIDMGIDLYPEANELTPKERLEAIAHHSEVVALWTEETDSGPVQCRGMLDRWDSRNAVIRDLKMVESANPKALERKIAAFGYDMQAVAYVRAIETIYPELEGRVEFEFLFCETSPPYAITPVKLGGTYRALGEAKWLRACEAWGRCVKECRWPYYAAGTIALEAPPWAMAEVYDEDETGEDDGQ